jgi:hypothetical protein
MRAPPPKMSGNIFSNLIIDFATAFTHIFKKLPLGNCSQPSYFVACLFCVCHPAILWDSRARRRGLSAAQAVEVMAGTTSVDDLHIAPNAAGEFGPTVRYGNQLQLCVWGQAKETQSNQSANYWHSILSEESKFGSSIRDTFSFSGNVWTVKI